VTTPSLLQNPDGKIFQIPSNFKIRLKRVYGWNDEDLFIEKAIKAYRRFMKLKLHHQDFGTTIITTSTTTATATGPLPKATVAVGVEGLGKAAKDHHHQQQQQQQLQNTNDRAASLTASTSLVTHTANGENVFIISPCSSKLFPSTIVEKVWKLHVLDITHYVQACNDYAGRLIGYHPDEFECNETLLDVQTKKERIMTTRLALKALFGRTIDLSMFPLEEEQNKESK